MRCRVKRRAAVLVESAVVYPLTFLLLIGLVVGGMGIARYQEVSALAREGARYASTHGAQYRQDAGLPIGTATDWQTDAYNNGILSKMVSCDPGLVTTSVSWPDVINQPGKPDNWPGSKVTVTVTYRWLPEVYLAGPFTFTSTSSMPITN